jgi:NTE family protein
LKEKVALILSGGIGLGAYQAGAYAVLHERDMLRLDWIAGSSVGAVNTVLIAGNAPERRLARLREFWGAGDPWGDIGGFAYALSDPWRISTTG